MLYVIFGFVLRQSCKRLIDAADGLVCKRCMCVGRKVYRFPTFLSTDLFLFSFLA